MGRKRKALKNDVPPAGPFMEEMARQFASSRQSLTHADVFDYTVAVYGVFSALARYCGEENARLIFARASAPPGKTKTSEIRRRQALLLAYMKENSLTPGDVAKELVGDLDKQRKYGLRGSNNPDTRKAITRRVQKLRAAEEKERERWQPTQAELQELERATFGEDVPF